MKVITRLWVLVAVLAVLAPAGIILPEMFRAGAAWGEWSPEEVKEIFGYIPEGLMALSSFWAAPIPDYTFKGWGGKMLADRNISYIISAIAGAFVTMGTIFLMGKWFSKKE